MGCQQAALDLVARKHMAGSSALLQAVSAKLAALKHKEALQVELPAGGGRGSSSKGQRATECLRKAGKCRQKLDSMAREK